MRDAFLASLGASSAAVDSAFGERLRIVPWLASQYGAGEPDPGREAIDIIGTLAGGLVSGAPAMGGGGWRGPPVPGAGYRVSFDAAAFAGEAAWPRTHDRIVALDRGDETYVLVSDARGDGLSRVYAEAVRL